MEIVDLYKNYKEEEKKWEDAGKPIRSSEEMLEIHNICSQCDKFEKDGGWIPGYDRCSICKCNLHESSTFMNKIAWGTTQCPDKIPKWGPNFNSGDV